ncbi:MAG: SCO family protein [Chloroflexi bacterium]|nr:SCO family protein [Chloroflexota bacterium]
MSTGPRVLAVMAALGLVVACGFWPERERGPGLLYQGTELAGEAPDFRLVDQEGRAVALRDFRGRVVVLTFLDTRCDETCPLTAAELRRAHRMLGEDAGEVAFLGVNVNGVFNRQEDVQAFTVQHRLHEIGGWHFLTGAREGLEGVWKDYAIAVEAQPGEEDFLHTPGVFLIDQRGQLRRYLSVPLQPEGLATPWEGPGLAEALAGQVEALLP